MVNGQVGPQGQPGQQVPQQQRPQGQQPQRPQPPQKQDEGLKVANRVYSVVGAGTKDEMNAVASNMIGGGINDPEMLAVQDNMQEIATSKFRTNENETKYKQALSVVSGIIRGTIEPMTSDMLIKTEDKDTLGLSGTLEGLTLGKTVGRFSLYQFDQEQ